MGFIDEIDCCFEPSQDPNERLPPPIENHACGPLGMLHSLASLPFGPRFNEVD
jgi:hypothetical protein